MKALTFNSNFMEYGKLANAISSNDDKALGKKFREEFLEKGKAHEKKFTAEDADPKELEMGRKVEREHTSCECIAERIALDHIAENNGSRYYSYLAIMEQLMEKGYPIEKLQQLL
jgi:hypothetical protein